jgi:hypothetical protein
MGEPMHDMIKRLFEAEHEWASIDIGPIAGSECLSLEQHAGFAAGQLVLRLDPGRNGEYFFALEDFRTARQLAHGLLGWAAVAEKKHAEQEEDIKTMEKPDPDILRGQQ